MVEVVTTGWLIICCAAEGGRVASGQTPSIGLSILTYKQQGKNQRVERVELKLPLVLD